MNDTDYYSLCERMESMMLLGNGLTGKHCIQKESSENGEERNKAIKKPL